MSGVLPGGPRVGRVGVGRDGVAGGEVHEQVQQRPQDQGDDAVGSAEPPVFVLKE